MKRLFVFASLLFFTIFSFAQGAIMELEENYERSFSSELKDCYIENSNSSSLSSIIMLFFLLSPVLIILYIRWKDKNQRNKK
mgnify:FL=1